MNKFRLIIDHPLNGPVNMAKDHAILHGLSRPDQLPTLRIYRWERPSVTIGYFQKIEDTVNVCYCRKNGISFTRRETGGGAVLHHMELTYSFTIPVKSGITPFTVEDSFRAIISPVINSLNILMPGVEYKPVNDILVNKKKISGSAQVRKRGILQQHGTLLMDIDNDILNSALIHDEHKISKKGFSSVRESLTSVKCETGNDINEHFIDDYIVTLISEFSKSFNIDFCIIGLSETESIMMESYSKKFASDEWNFKR